VIEFPSPFGPRPAYLFPFSDQVLYPRTMKTKTALTRLAIEPERLARLLAVAVRVGAARIVARERVRNALARHRPDRAPSGTAQFALRVDVIHDGRPAQATLVGGAQADAAAAGASATVRAMIEGEVSEPGVWMPEQVMSPPGFFSRLATHGLTVVLPSAVTGARGTG
jgi:saccharopine dehydrogenase-like NADP-dependent oxidoreductase